MEGRNMPSDPSLRGAWAGVTRDHDSARLYRGILESNALEYAIYRDAVAALHPGLAFMELRITGGGSRESAWNAIKADALGMRIVTIDGSGGAPLGAALVAAAACGAVPDLASAARAWVRPGTERLPDPRHREIYARRQANYERLLGALSGFPA